MSIGWASLIGTSKVITNTMLNTDFRAFGIWDCECPGRKVLRNVTRSEKKNPKSVGPLESSICKGRDNRPLQFRWGKERTFEGSVGICWGAKASERNRMFQRGSAESGDENWSQLTVSRTQNGRCGCPEEAARRVGGERVAEGPGHPEAGGLLQRTR